MQVYLGPLPAVNMIGMRDGSEAKSGAGYNVLPVWKRRMDGCQVPGADAERGRDPCDVLPGSHAGRAAGGAGAARVLGVLCDFWQRPLTDVGLVGPDKGEGGQFLLVPPHYDGPPLPGGYYTSAATARIGGRA
jgi:hypothetical protein